MTNIAVFLYDEMHLKGKNFPFANSIIWVKQEQGFTIYVVCYHVSIDTLKRGGMGKADFIEWIKADFQEWSKADSTYAASQQTLFIVSGSPSNLILGEVTQILCWGHNSTGG